MRQAEIADRAQESAEGFATRQLDQSQEYLDFMRGQADITNAWAEEDRSRYRETFIPLQDDWIAEAQNFDTPEQRAAASNEAVGDVRQQFALGRQQQERQLAAAGVKPGSGRYQSSLNRATTTEALAAAGGSNAARRRVEDTGRAMRASAVNMGNGLAVNPGTSMGLSNAAGGAGYGGAMNGISSAAGISANGAQTAMQGQQGIMNGLNMQYNQQMQAWSASQQGMNSLMSGLGTAAGFAFASSKEIKKNKRKPMSTLDAVRSMPVEEWEYMEGKGDGGKHVGPYAEDFQKATGLGSGKEISVIDAIGVTMGAVQELAGKVDKLTAPQRAAA